MCLDYAKARDALCGMTGEEVSLVGRLIVTGNNSFLAASYDAFTRGEFLRISDAAQIPKELLRTLPAYGGGECLYDDECWITGTIAQTDAGLQLVDVSSCDVRRKDFQVSIKPESRVRQQQ